MRQELLLLRGCVLWREVERAMRRQRRRDRAHRGEGRRGSVSRFSAAGPAIFEARDAAVVELDGAGVAAHGTDHLFVGDGERDVDGDGDGEELDGCGMAQEPEGEE